MTSIAPAVAAWFEIPVTDLALAITFYETLFTVALKRETIAGMDMAVFPYEKPAVSGALVQTPNLKPSADGVVIYINSAGRMDTMLSAVGRLGGEALSSPIPLPPGMGRIAFIRDCEGNRIGLHEV